MIVGGYNIVDFEGAVFNADSEVELSDEIVSKFIDNSKPVLTGNYYCIHDGVKYYLSPTFSGIITFDDTCILNVGISLIHVNISTKKAIFSVTI